MLQQCFKAFYWESWFLAFAGGVKLAKYAKNGYFGHFDPPQIRRKPRLSVKCFKMLLGHIIGLSKIGLRINLLLEFRRNGKFSVYLVFPLYFSSISYIKYDPFVGGSNDLRLAWNFFPELFMIFLHRKKIATKFSKNVYFWYTLLLVRWRECRDSQ